MLALAGAAAAAPWTSPGTGQNYTMSTLAVAAGGTVNFQGPGCNYDITDTVTISYGDRLNQHCRGLRAEFP
jgi:hypothetical protein